MEKFKEYRSGKFGLRIPDFFTYYTPRTVNLGKATLSLVGDTTPKKPNEEYLAIKALERSSMELSNLLEESIFVVESLSFLTSKITGNVPSYIPERHSQDLFYDGGNLDCSRDEERLNIEVRKRDVNLVRPNLHLTMKSLASFLVNGPLCQHSQDFPETDTPEVFLRAFRSSCHTVHDRTFGFRSSGHSSTQPDYEASTLQGSLYLNKNMLRNQCEGNNPSELIAMSDSPARIFNYTKTWKFADLSGEVIAVINVSKLKRMGVLFNRTTTLATHLGLSTKISHPNRLSYANENYWVAYRWVPAECIECYLTISDLYNIYEEKRIGEDDYSMKLTLGDLPVDSPLIASMQSLHL